MTVLEDIIVTTRIIAFERYNFICRKQKKAESLEQFQADLVELASRADCGDRESEWVRDMFTAHMNNEKIAEELLAQTQYEYAIRREKGIEQSRTMKINPLRGRYKSRYITLIHVADKTSSTIKTISEVGVVSAADRIHVDHKTQGVSNNNNETKIQDNVISVGINMVRTIYNHVQQKTKFARNAQNADILQKFVVLQT